MIIPANCARELAALPPARGDVNITIHVGGTVAKKQTSTRAEDLRLLETKTSYEFKGVKYNLVSTHRAIIQWEELTGFGFFADSWKIFDRPSLKALAGYVYCLLSLAGFKGRYDEVAEHLGKHGNMRPALEAVSAAYIASQVEKSEAVAGPPPPMKQ